MGEQGSNIRIDNVRATITALREFTPDIEKAVDAQIKQSLGRVRSAAQAGYPKGSWVIGRSRKKMLGYIAARAGGKRTGSWGESSGGIRAGIFEFIGTSYAGDRPQVTGLINSLTTRYGTPGRFLWAAWDAVGGDVLADIEESVRGAERELQARLDAAGEEY